MSACAITGKMAGEDRIVFRHATAGADGVLFDGDDFVHEEERRAVGDGGEGSHLAAVATR